MVSVAGGAPRAGGPSGLREGPPGAARGRLESVARWMGVEEEWERVPGPGAPGQDRRIDLPTIGPDTVAQVAAAGLGGIVWEAGGVILLEREAAVAAARDAGLFLWARA